MPSPPDAIENVPVSDLIHMRLPESEARAWLLRLTPDQVTPELLDCLMTTLQETAIAIPLPDGAVMDCCGTGGSNAPHYNTSTTVAFILAAGGAPVVKFGNRALSSKSGSFDFLEAIGLPVETPPEALPEIVSACGLAFLYAPQCYPVLAPFNRLRREVGVRTIFNFLGPLLNPVQPAWRLLGVSHCGMQSQMAEHLRRRETGLKRAWLVHGRPPGSFGSSASSEAANHNTPDGLDEMTPQGVTRIVEISAAQVREIHLERALDPVAGPSAASPGDPAQNAAVFRSLIDGEDAQSPIYEAVCLNAGAGLFVAERAGTLEDGVALARRLLAEGAVRQTWEQCRRTYARFQ